MDDPNRHGCRLRTGRHSQPHGCYLVTAVTHERQPIFREFQLGHLLVQVLHGQHQRGVVDSLAFVIMPDHLHWLIQVGEKYPLQRIIQFTKSMSARRINAACGHPGRRIWQAGFHDHALRREEDLQAVARYVIANPIRSGLVKTIGDYPLWDAAWL